MSSRMERIYGKTRFEGRSSKNKSIYESIKDLDSYSNIEAVRSIDTTNQVDITKVKELLNSREGFKNERKYHQVMKDSPISVERPKEDKKNTGYDIMDVKPIEKVKKQKEKNYDVVDVINKAKESSDIKDEKFRSLKNTEYKELNDLNLRKKEYKDSEEELKELIHTISSNSELNKLGEGDLLDELKSDTMVGDASSISKIIEKEKKLEPTITEDLDKSFFGNSFGFSKKDFDDLSPKKKSKAWLIILIIIVVIIVALACGYFFVLK